MIKLPLSYMNGKLFHRAMERARLAQTGDASFLVAAVTGLGRRRALGARRARAPAREDEEDGSSHDQDDHDDPGQPHAGPASSASALGVCRRGRRRSRVVVAARRRAWGSPSRWASACWMVRCSARRSARRKAPVVDRGRHGACDRRRHRRARRRRGPRGCGAGSASGVGSARRGRRRLRRGRAGRTRAAGSAWCSPRVAAAPSAARRSA